MIYYNLSVPLRCILILAMFLEFCFGAYIIFLLRLRKKPTAVIITLSAMLLSLGLMIIYTAEARAKLRHLEVPAISDWLCQRSVLLPIAVIIGVLLLELYIFRAEWLFRKNTITRSSIKEGVDKISSGLCFYRQGGRVILANNRINELCFKIAGKDLQNAQSFWNLLKDGEPVPGAQRLQGGNQPVFRLEDGRVWTFSCQKLSDIFQLSAADTTEIHAVTEKLREKNKELEALNMRLRKYGENVDELTRAKERLETKSRIHGELGQALMASRRWMMAGDNGDDMPLEQWRSSIAMLRKEAELESSEKPLEMLQRISASTGISTQITGELPQPESVQRLFVEAAAEALTNAISHARAKTLFISLAETELSYSASFRNDGTRPDGEITEGGGLSSLRKKLEREGGSMEIKSRPDFELLVTLPKKGGDEL